MIPCQRHLFDIPDDIAYLNCAYMSPLMRASIAVGQEALARKARPWTIRPPDFFDQSERCRALFATMIGAAADDVAIVPAASYGMAVAAGNLDLPAGGRVLVLADQFPSNVHVWEDLAKRHGAEVVRVEAGEDGDLTAAVLGAIDERVRIAALPHCRWTDGLLLDLPRIAEALRAIGAALALDLTQSAGALPFDVREVRPDFAVAATYKWLLGPYSLGFCYVAPERQDGRPLEHNWIARAGSEDFTRLVDYAGGFQPGARRFDVGERSNFALMPAVRVALEQLLAWGVPAIAATLAARTDAIATQAESLGLRAHPLGRRAGHFLGLAFAGEVPRDLPERLAEQRVHVSLRGQSLRVTPHLYNHDGDVDRLLDVLATAL